MKVRTLRDFYGITKDKIYEVVGKRGGVEVCVIDDSNYNHWLTFADYEIVEEPTLKEKYFISGNVAETREGNKYLIVNDGAMRLDGEGFIRKSETKDDLTGMNFLQFDFMKVYKMTQLTAFNYIEKYGELELIWQREEKVKEVTMAELEKQYGCKVKVVK